MDYDVAVVGGSSTGLIAARECVLRGLRTAVFEEDEIIGRPEKCAGLYSVEGIKSLNIPLKGPYHQNTVRGAVFTSPFGKSFEIDAGREIAVVYNRERLDQFLAEQAVRSGADLFVGSRVHSAQTDGRTCSVKTSDGEIISKHLVVAEGRTATIAKQIFPHYAIGKWLPIIQVIVSGHRKNPDLVYLHFKKYLKEYFGYLVPVDDEIGKVGVAATKHTTHLLNKFLAEEFPKTRILGFSSSSIYVGPPLKKNIHQNVLLVGDVAGHVKATTGGGVVTGGKAAKAVAIHLADENSFENSFRETFNELKRMYLIRSVFEKLSPKQIDLLIKSVAESGFASKLSEGDMDRHAATIIRAAASKSFFKLGIHILRNMLNAAAYV